ncbi:hypothetical protein F4561_004443 [Lipingzhangella halophila]|uniref:Uncharacterized protein n=1 Tax=Lipingzhangella halophila TaxID=1783352 RepID=A0A7W7RLA8_9ACTN|nr:hypothetical protein [Lipingzhangella halophila]MBB4933623.1 hypothetical protein [Lipingzhangella halophila]
MTPGNGPDDRSYDYAAELGALPAWGPLALVAAVAARVTPAYRVLADAAENAVHASVVDALGQAREVDTVILRHLHDDLLPLWPEDEGEMDVLTPYYWKMRALHVLKVGLEHAVDDPVRGARMAEQTAVDMIDDFDSRVEQEGIDRPLALSSEETSSYAVREFGNFLHDVAALREEADPETAVWRIREHGSAEAEFLEQELLPLWIQAENWAQADLESAHGAEHE